MSVATQVKPVTSAVPTAASDEAEIRRLINDWSRALEAKDADGMVAHYADDAVLYHMMPPYKMQGRAAIRQLRQDCLPHFPARLKSEYRDLQIAVSGDVAFVFGLHRMQPIDPPDHPTGRSWVRLTACYRKIAGAWKAVHEHVSMPFDCTTGQIAPITNPDAA